MSGSGSNSWSYIYLFKNRLKDSGDHFIFLFPLLVIGISSLIGFLGNIDSVHPAVFIIPGVCLLLASIIIIRPFLKKKKTHGK